MPQLSNRTPDSHMLVELTQHYSNESWKEPKGWEADTYSPKKWQDRKMWSDVGQGTPKPSPLSSHFGNDGNVDRELYQNLVEMIPLVESFMDKNKAIARQASLVYTPTPTRDWPLKKAVDSPAKGKKGRQLFRGNRGEVKDSFMWNDCEDTPSNDNRKEHLEEIPMLPLSSDVAKNFVSKAEMLQLQSQIDQLEQKLHEKDTQLQSAEISLKQIDLLQMQMKVEELQKEVWDKERQIQNVHTQLFDKQQEIADLQSLLKKLETDALESNKKALGTEEELNSLRCQVAALIFLLENIQVQSACDHAVEACLPAENLTINALPLKDLMESEENITPPHLEKTEIEDMELVRRKYLAAIIAARENPGEELLSLVAEFRLQLQAFLMQPPFTSLVSDVIVSQIPRFSLC